MSATQKTPTLLIIDGSSMLSTSYYGNLPKSILFEKDEAKKLAHYDEILHTSSGLYTNAIFTMFRSMLALFRAVQPEYAVFVFDRTRDTFRRTQLHAEMYKAQRKETPEPLKQQFGGMEQALTDIGFKVLSGDDYEADDYAASIVRKFESPTLRILLHTKDHDYEQLVSEQTRLWRQVDKDKAEKLKQTYGLFAGTDGYADLPAGIFEYTPEIVLAEEGVAPLQIPQLWGIVGDPSDGIPGCKGVASAAAPLIREYGTIENLYAAIDECADHAGKEKALSAFWKEWLGVSRSPIKNLKENRSDVFLSRDLAIMKDDIEISYDLKDFVLPQNNQKYIDILQQYELSTIISDIQKKGIC